MNEKEKDERLERLEKRLERECDGEEELEDVRRTFFEIDKEQLKDKSLSLKARLHWAWIIFSGNAACKAIRLKCKAKAKLLLFTAWLFTDWRIK